MGMLGNGFGDFNELGFSDQQGLHVCMFDNPKLVSLDYSSTLSMQLNYFTDGVLYERDGQVYNGAPGGVSQCFVHGDGDTLKSWWPKLFPTLNKTQDWGKNFTA